MGRDVTSLRAKLSSTDLTAPAIQASAAAMMSFYDAPEMAVSEWRNVLQSCQTSQMLPLLYVANEVLQTSKRNRGTKFLEAFGPVLGSSLRFICERDRSSTEKVRRTVKILGDRFVFSLRFVTDILAGLEQYRGGNSVARQTPQQSSPPTSNTSSNNYPQTQSNLQSSTSNVQSKKDESSDDDEDLFGDDNGDDEEDEFGNSTPSLLNVSNFSAAVQSSSTEQKSSFGATGSKRRRSLEAKVSPKRKKGRQSSTKKRSQVLSTSTFMEKIQQLEALEDEYQSVSRMISSITSEEFMSKSVDDQEDVQEVGDELIQLHSNVNKMIDSLANHRRKLHSIAESKRELEFELKRYLVWLTGTVNADEEEQKLCDTIEEKLGLVQVVHEKAKKARDEKRAKEAAEKAAAEELARKKAEEEELKRSLEQIQKEKAPKEGMVWNRQLREYQSIADVTEESWRD